jgi:ribosomal protein L11 methylase PrmA
MIKQGRRISGKRYYFDRLEDITETAKQHGLYVEAVDTQGGWVVMQMRREE